jgi:hypothetical protein
VKILRSIESWKPRLGITAAWIYLVGAMAFVLWSSIFTFLFRHEVLYRDQWHVYVDFFRLPFWQSIWIEQNGHRLVFPNLFFYLDNYVFSGTNVFLLVCILIMNGAAAYLLIPRGPGYRSTNRNLMRFCSGFVFILVFWLINRADIARGLGIHYYLPVLCAVAACRFIAFVGCGNHIGKTGKRADLGLAAAIGCCVITTFSFGNGMAIWPALGAVAVWRKLPIRYLVVIVVSGALSIAAYFIGMPPPNDTAASVFSSPLGLLLFIVSHVGSPIAHALMYRGTQLDGPLIVPAMIGSLTVLLAGGFGLQQLFRRFPMASDVAFRLGVVFFALGSSSMIGLARLETSTPFAPRYVVWSLLLWAAVVSLVPLMCAELTSRHKLASRVIILVVIGLTFCILPSQYRQTLSMGIVANRTKEAGLSLGVGVTDRQAVRNHLFKHPEVVDEVVDELKRRNWNLFSDPRFEAMDQPFEQLDQVAVAPTCRGTLTSAERLPESDGDWRIMGWAWHEELRRPPQYILIVNDAGLVKGIAELTRGNVHHVLAQKIYNQERRLSIQRHFSHLWPSLFRQDLGWFGYVRDTEDLSVLSLIGVFEDGSNICLLESPCEDLKITDTKASQVYDLLSGTMSVPVTGLAEVKFNKKNGQPYRFGLGPETIIVFDVLEPTTWELSFKIYNLFPEQEVTVAVNGQHKLVVNDLDRRGVKASRTLHFDAVSGRNIVSFSYKLWNRAESPLETRSKRSLAVNFMQLKITEAAR